MKLNEKYKKRLIFQINKPPDEAQKDILGEIKNSRIYEEKILILIKPSFFDPFAARGSITLQLFSENNGENTKIECWLNPRSFNHNGIYFVVFFLFLFNIIGLLISQNLYTFITIIVSWIMLIGVLHATQLLNRGKLESYISYYIKKVSSPNYRK